MAGSLGAWGDEGQTHTVIMLDLLTLLTDYCHFVIYNVSAIIKEKYAGVFQP